ncbi:MAG: glycosyltransferase family 4 protein [Bacteroidota bacterium]|nr:glycosyltransferase family 4 protein [Bacteroidota bacterium]
MKKKILYLSYHYEPDLSAGSFRNAALAKQMAESNPETIEIDVYCTKPNRYDTLRIESKDQESFDNLNIFRISVGLHGGGFIKQIWAFLQYYFGVFKAIKNKEYQLIFASSSKLFTAFLSYRISKKINVPYYLDVRDLFAENLKELIPIPVINILVSKFCKYVFEIPTFKNAIHLNVNSAAFLDYLTRYSEQNHSFFPNGIDSFFLKKDYPYLEYKKPYTILYAGNIGHGQGLEKFIPDLAEQLGLNFHIVVIGDGTTKKQLLREIAVREIYNVTCVAPMKRESLLEYYRQAHYLLVHLNDYTSFKFVLPSKIFEYACFGVPILAGVEGYSAQFIKEEMVENVFVFKPFDVRALVEYLNATKYVIVDRKEFIKKYQRTTINKQMSNSILQYVN